MNHGAPALAAACALALTGCTPPLESAADNEPLTGRQIFLTRCVVCHQADGSGLPGLYAPLPTSVRLGGPPAPLVRIMLLGMKGPVHRDGKTFHGLMPSWRFDLTDSQIADVLNDMRQRWAPGAPAIPTDLVSSIRAETVSAPLFPSADEVARWYEECAPPSQK